MRKDPYMIYILMGIVLVLNGITKQEAFQKYFFITLGLSIMIIKYISRRNKKS